MRHHPGHAAAFAEGRRLREAAEMRRQARHYQGHYPGWYGSPLDRHHPGPSPWALVLIAPIVLGGLGAMTVTVFAVVAVLSSLLPMLMIGTALVVSARRRRRRESLRRGGSAGTAPLPGRPAAPPRPDLVWERARARFHAVRGEYAAFECDTMQVLRLPALADVSVASTGRFVEAFAEAQALETDVFPAGRHAADFVTAADRAERAWRAARDAAERIRLSGLSPAERATVEKVIKLLTTARDSDSDPERLAAYTRARSELARLDSAGVIHIPRLAKAALDTAARGVLPA